jgi:3-hydroxybutyryl-CoA dehydratase
VSLIRKQVLKGLRVGQTFSISRTFLEQDVNQFAEISRDYNPIHCDARFAKAKRFDGTVCHGLLVASMLTEVGGQLGWLASGMNLEFKKPVYFGDTIRCDFTITALSLTGHAEAKAVFTNEDKTKVLLAVITGILPGEREKRIMAKMMAEGDPTNTGKR